jgi:hypothetical protein
MPDDLAEALAAEPKAAAMFALLTSQNRYAILYRSNPGHVGRSTRARDVPPPARRRSSDPDQRRMKQSFQPKTQSADHETLLVNFWFDRAVGHTIEALRYALGYHRANPALALSMLLPAGSALELTSCCPFVERTYAVKFTGLFNGSENPRHALQLVPRQWDYVVDDARGHMAPLRERFVGLRRYYDAASQHFQPRLGTGVAGSPPPAYEPHRQLRLALPASARQWAENELAGAGVRIAVMPAGSDESWNYPSIQSWEEVLGQLARTFNEILVCLIGKLHQDDRTGSGFSGAGLARLRRGLPRVIDSFDRPILEQLALVEQCDVFLSPHTGFGSAALAVGTPWLSIAGGRWHEWFFNGVPFYSVIPDPDRYPTYAWEASLAVIDDDEDGEGPRAACMSRARIRDDLPEVLQAAKLLVDNQLPYDAALERYFPRLLRAYGGDRSPIFTLDDIHTQYL